MKSSMMASAVVLLALLGGCESMSGGSSTTTNSGSGGSTPISRSGSSRVDTAVRIAQGVQANPDRADAVLREHGMTVEEYEDLMYEIAADPAMSEEFNSRMGG
jgi:hypothetical protein